VEEAELQVGVPRKEDPLHFLLREALLFVQIHHVDLYVGGALLAQGLRAPEEAEGVTLVIVLGEELVHSSHIPALIVGEGHDTGVDVKGFVGRLLHKFEEFSVHGGLELLFGGPSHLRVRLVSVKFERISGLAV